MVAVSPEDFTKLVELLTNGLGTDGAHHKNWYLDQALRALLGESSYTFLRKTYEDMYDWDEGIPP